jgi:hypothetical protein
MEIAIDKSELDDLAKWKGLAVQLREYALAHGSLVTPPVTPSHSQTRAPSSVPSPLAGPPPAPWPWAVGLHRPWHGPGGNGETLVARVLSIFKSFA